MHRGKTANAGALPLFPLKNPTVTINDDHKFNSMVCLDLHITLGNKSLRHVTIYRPPPSNNNGLTVKLFFDEFSNLIESLMVSSCRCVITGDFNLHLNEDNPDAKHFVHILNSGSFTQHVNTATHNKGHVLDLVITDSQNNIISNLKIVPGLPSDHAALVFNVDFPRHHAPSKCTVKRRNTRGIDSFTRDLSETPLIKNMSTDLNTAVSQYNSTLRSLVDKYAPEKNSSNHTKTTLLMVQ